MVILGPPSGNGQMLGSQGQRVEVGIFGEQNTAQLRDHISMHFGYGFSTEDIISGVGGNGTLTSSNLNLVLTGTTGAVSCQTRRNLLYRPGHTIIVGGTVSFSGTGSGTIGLYNASYGFRIGYNLNTRSWFFVREFAGTEISEVSNTGADLSVFDPGDLNIWRIKYGYYGVAACVIEMLKPGSLDWVPCHIFMTHGTLTHSHSFPNLPVRMDASAGCTITTASFQAGTFGGDEQVGFRQFNTDSWAAIGDINTETAVAVFRSVPTFNGQTNGMLAKLLAASFASDLEGVGIVRIYRDATLAGTPTWVDVRANESVIQTATVVSANPTVGTGVRIFSTHLATGNSGVGASIAGGDVSFQDIELWAGENAVITVQRLFGTTNYSFGLSFSWREYH